MPLASVDWTPVLVALITAAVQLITLYVVVMNRRDIRPPSGGTLGEVVERAHQLSAADVALSVAVLGHAGGDVEAARRLLRELLDGDADTMLRDEAQGKGPPPPCR